MLRSISASSFLAGAGALILYSSVALADVTSDQCIDANAKAQSLRREGKLAAARAQLQICVDPHCPGMVRDDCARRLDDLEHLQPTIVFDGKDPSGGDVSAVAVTVDGRRFADKLDGSPLAIDPGAHTFTFQAVGQPLVTRSFVVKEGEKGRIERIVLGVAAPSGGPALPPAGASAEPPAIGSRGDGLSPPAEGAHHGLGTRKAVALVLGGAGIAGIAVGSVFGLLASSAWSSSKNECSAASCPASTRAQAVTDHDSAVSDGTLADIGFIAGGALLAGGAILFFTAPSSRDAASDHARRWQIGPVFGPATAGIDMRGEF